MDTTTTASKQPIIPHTVTHNASADNDHELESPMQPENRNNSSNDDEHKRTTTTTKLLRECASSMSRNDAIKVRHLLWMLNELASPYGDRDEKLAYYFLQPLLCKAMDSGYSHRKTLISVPENRSSFNSVRRRILKFQEVSPWTTFGHVASNGAMLEAFEGEPKLHIIDISNINNMCTQWPTFLESLATRNGETPALKLTVVFSVESTSFMKEIARRIEKFARLMGVRPFEFTVITSDVNRLEELTKERLGVQEDEAVAVNCIGALARVDIGKRNGVIQMICSLRPKVVTVVEEEADFSSTPQDGDFVERFNECLRFYTIYFDMLEESFGVTSTDKLVLERECSRSIVRALACDDDRRGGEMRERGSRWSERLRESGFSPIAYSHDVVEDVRALLKRYKAGWSLAEGGGGGGGRSGIYMAWKEEPVVWASVWKPDEQ